MDREFDCMIPNLRGLDINSIKTIEHVPDTEGQIWVIKERGLLIRIKMPFKRTSMQIIIELLKLVVMCLNALPAKIRLSPTFTTRTTITDTTLDWKKHGKAEFGYYCEFHKENQPLNNINNERIRSGICLGTTTNLQGRYTFLCLTTGKSITCNQFRMVPMPSSVTSCIEDMATIILTQHSV